MGLPDRAVSGKVQPKKTGRSEQFQKVYSRLKKIRESKTLSFRPTPLLREEIADLDGTTIPFKLRYYQVIGAFHLLAMKRMILGDDTGLGKCVTGDTLVVTDQGLVPIWQLAPDGELEPGKFYDPKGSIRVWTGQSWAGVRRFFWNGEAETRRVVTRNGYTIEGSLQHGIYVRDVETGEESFVKLPDLDPDRHWVCINRDKTFAGEDPLIPEPGDFASNTRQYNWPRQLTPDLARLLGYVVGEAWTGSRNITNVSQHRDVNPETHDDIRRLFREVYCWTGNEGSQEKDKVISVSSVFIREHLRVCGVSSALSAEKSVPWVVLRGSYASAVGFLRGLFEGEGSVCKDGGVELSTASKRLAREVHQLLLVCGIVSKLSTKTVKGRDHTYWRIQFFGDDARIFQDTIGFVSSRKVNALQDVLARPSTPNKDVIPGMADFFEEVRDQLGNVSRFGNSVRGTLMHVARGRRNPTYAFLRDLWNILNEEGLEDTALHISDLLGRNTFFDPIATIEEGYAPVMDIEVEHSTHAFVGNGFVNHNTIEAITALCYLWEKKPKNKVIVIAPKSAIRQWASEIKRFTKGVKPIIVTGGKGVDTRKAAYTAFEKAPTGPNDPKVVLIMNYAVLVRDWNEGGFQPTKPNGKPDPKKPVLPGLLDALTRKVGGDLTVIFDEATAFKNMRTKTWEIARYLSDRADRCYALTATLLKNNLLEGYCIYKAVKPDVFSTKTKFHDVFCYVEMKRVAGNRRIPVILGYKNLDQFRETIDPYYLGRKKHAVSDELPTLISRDIVCELSQAENVKYAEALEGILELGDGEIRDYEENKGLVSLNYCQQIVNSLSTLRFDEGQTVNAKSWGWDENEWIEHKVGKLGSKEQAFFDLITDELEDEKVIVFTRYETLVGRLQAILRGAKIKSTRITGKEKDETRRENQEEFQDLKSDTRVIFITTAGSEAINLQAAGAMIYYDLPWSWGDYVQILGRMIRIGSPHKGVRAYHILAELPMDKKADRKSIDHHVLKLLRGKKNLIDKVLGEAAVGALKFEKKGSSMKQLVRALQGKTT